MKSLDMVAQLFFDDNLVYLEGRYPVVSPTKAELAALHRSRAAFRRGDAVSVSQFLDDVTPPPSRIGSKRLPKTISRRPRAR